MDGDNTVAMVHLRERPARKLIQIRGCTCEEYFAFCEEVGCDTWGKLCAIQGALYEPFGMWMPLKLQPEGTSFYTQGVEVPLNYSGPVPDGFEVLELPPALHLFFQGAPYAGAEMVAEIEKVQAVIRRFDPQPFGYDWADGDAPRVQLAPVGARGYIEGRPVVRLPSDVSQPIPF